MSFKAIILCFTCLLLMGCRHEWVLLTSQHGGFSVLMPTRPKESITEQPRTNGAPIEVHTFSISPNESEEIAVIYNDYPEDLPFIASLGSDWFFDNLQNAILQKLGGSHLIISQNRQFASHPMREFKFEVQDKKVTYEMRIIVVGHRMYQLSIASQVGVDVSHDAETLFNSFHLSKE